MKAKLLIMTVLFSVCLFAQADEKLKQQSEEIEISVNTDGDKITKKVVVNGKELSADEIKEFEASGKMKIIHLDKDMKGMEGHKMIFINSEGDSEDSNVNIEVIMDKLTDMGNGQQVWSSDDGKEIKIIRKEFKYNDDGASLGIVASIEDDGWHLSETIDGSGAKEAGILAGDLIVEIANVNLVKDKNDEENDIQKLPKFKVGENVKVNVLRDGKLLKFNVKAMKLDKNLMLVGSGSDGEHFKWLEKMENGDALSSKEIKVMVFSGDDADFRLNTDDIHMLFPDDLGDMNFFISDGKSTSKLLGKNHEMSSLSDDLGKYFSTKGGVLVLHVDESNAFDLKDGDVIKSINGNSVNSPKDVVKNLIKADNQEKIKLRVIRHKKSKTLKYRK